MTRKEQIKEYLLTIGNGEMNIPFDAGFECGVEWADIHPHWISVEDELPPLNETFIAGFSDGEAMLVDFDNREEERQDYIETVKAFTHWMPMPALPKKGDQCND